MTAYINSLDTGHTPFLEKLEQEAKAAHVPIIRREMQSFLKVFLAVQKPKRILEVGTAVGFSAILMAEYGVPEGDAHPREGVPCDLCVSRRGHSDTHGQAALPDRCGLFRKGPQRLMFQ